MAVRTGLSQSTIWRVMDGRDVKLTTLAEVIEALGYQMRIEFDPVDDAAAMPAAA